MPNRVWSHICKYVAQAPNGEWLPVEEISFLKVRSVPVVINRFHAISNWSGNENEKFTIQVVLKSPSGGILGESKVDPCVIKRNRDGVLSQRRLDAVFEQIPIRELGEYRVEFIVDNAIFHSMSFVIASAES
jgi:hypothetical protein